MRARAAVKQLRTALGKALKQALPKGLPEAIAACQLRAPAVAKAVSEAGIAVGRTSRKLRNPRNAPKAWMVPLLSEFEATPGQAAGFRTVALSHGQLGYAEPIYVKGICLVCHGKALAPDVSAAIAERYPKDAAHGYAAGELRGMFWAVVPAP